MEPLRPVLLCSAGTRLCALPLEVVVETMRPLPVERLRGVPAYLLGLATVRGGPLPVLSLARLLGDDEQTPEGRFVRVRAGERGAVFRVRAVLGVERLAPAQLERLPPLLEGAAEEVLEGLGARDGSVLLLLRAARCVPERVWSELAAARPA